ncbi:hypothetical protein Tco_0091854 [Tanacetum coccineum]
MSSDEASSRPWPWEPKQGTLSPDYIPGPEYPKYLAPSDEEVPVEDQPYVVVDSPIALSSGYITDSDPKEDQEDESEDGLVDYPADRGDDDEDDDDDDDSSRDDADDKDEEEASNEEEEEEHPAPTDSTAAASPVETDPFETDESAATPPPPPPAYHTTARMSIRAHALILFPSEVEAAWLLVIPTPPPSLLTPLSSPLPQIPSPPFLLPSPPTYTSPTYAEVPLGYMAAEIRLRTASPLPSSPLPPPSSPSLPLIDPVAARQPGLEAARTTDYGFIDMVDDAPRRHVPREVGHCITNTWDELVDAIQEGALTTLEGVNARVTELAETHERDTQDLYAHLKDAQDSQSRLLGRVDILFEDRQFHQLTVILMEDKALVSREAWAQDMGYSVSFHYKL